jgi:fructosamine-3-kinase
MSLPAHVANDVSAALVSLGLGERILRATAVGGGCIHNGTRIETDRGTMVFLKWNTSAPAGMFAAEVDGLRSLRTVDGVRAPEPLDLGDHWLLLEHIDTGRESHHTATALGRMLAALHSEDEPSATFGWERDNWIGSLPQANPPTERWGEFWRDQRIVPQLERARALGYAKQNVFDRLLVIIPDALADVERAELVHGDLWGGNWLTDTNGEPWLIDPAVYLGHGEVDLAMSELFGGFDRAFYRAYDEAHGRTSAYDAYRRDLYQLYYLLVHVNLFGASYEAGARRAAERVVAALR